MKKIVIAGTSVILVAVIVSVCLYFVNHDSPFKSDSSELTYGNYAFFGFKGTVTKVIDDYNVIIKLTSYEKTFEADGSTEYPSRANTVGEEIYVHFDEKILDPIDYPKNVKMPELVGSNYHVEYIEQADQMKDDYKYIDALHVDIIDENATENVLTATYTEYEENGNGYLECSVNVTRGGWEKESRINIKYNKIEVAALDGSEGNVIDASKLEAYCTISCDADFSKVYEIDGENFIDVDVVTVYK